MRTVTSYSRRRRFGWILFGAQIGQHGIIREVLAEDGEPFFEFLRRHRIHIVRLQEELWGRLFLKLVSC